MWPIVFHLPSALINPLLCNFELTFEAEISFAASRNSTSLRKFQSSFPLFAHVFSISLLIGFNQAFLNFQQVFFFKSNFSDKKSIDDSKVTSTVVVDVPTSLKVDNVVNVVNVGNVANHHNDQQQQTRGKEKWLDMFENVLTQKMKKQVAFILVS